MRYKKIAMTSAAKKKMIMDFLDFEKPIVELEKQIDDLRHNLSEEHVDVEIDDEIRRLEQKCEELTKKI